MKRVLLSASLLLMMATGRALGEERTFPAPTVDGKRLDLCLVWGGQCGQAAADAWCKLQGFESSKAWTPANDIGAQTPTLVLTGRQVCDQPGCDGFSAITCTRAGQAPSAPQDALSPRSALNVGQVLAQSLGFTRQVGVTYTSNTPILRFYRMKDAFPGQCEADCARDPGCTAYTYVRPGGYNAGDPPMCYLFSGAGPTVNSDCCTSGQRTAQMPQAGTQSTGFGPWQNGMDLFGAGDYRSFALPQPNPDLCLAECARDARCRAVTYTRPGTYGSPSAACWLKAGTGSFGPHANAMSAIKGGSVAPPPPPPVYQPPPVVNQPPPPPPPPPVATGLTGEWTGPTRYTIVQTGNSFRWTAFGGAEIGQGTISGEELQVTWTGGGAATGRISERNPQGLPMAIQWNNGVQFRRIADTGSSPTQAGGCDDIKGHWFYRGSGSGGSIYVFHETFPPGTWAVGGFEVDVKFPGHADRWGPVRCLGNNRFEFQRSNGNAFMVATLRNGRLVQDDGTYWDR